MRPFRLVQSQAAPRFGDSFAVISVGGIDWEAGAPGTREVFYG